MKRIILSMITVLTWGCIALAQQPWINDAVTIGVSVSGVSKTTDNFYSLQNGLKKSDSAKDWHLAFAVSPIGDSAAIWANHQSGNAFVKVYNVHKDFSQWTSVSLADTAIGTMCYNNDQGWHQGALNAIPSADPYNFGWGHYDFAVTHNIIGDSVFIVKANGIFYKFFTQLLNPYTTSYTFMYENLSTPSATIIDSVVKGTTYTNRNFMYYNLESQADTNREPANTDWDIVFNRYTTDAVGSGQGTNNNVLGVFQNHGVTVAKAMQVHVDTAYVNNATYTVNLSPIISKIGYDWKTFNMTTFSYDVPDSVSYFVKDKSNNIWQLQFQSYDNQITGEIAFRKRLLAPLAIADINSTINRYSIYPNPAQENINIVIDAKTTTDAHIALTDFTGKIVLTTTIKVNNGMNAFLIPCNSVANGTYVLSIKGTNININEKIIVAK